MDNDPILIKTIKTLSQFNPKSIFLYGSRGRGDAVSNSDYEVGIIFDDEKYVERKSIHSVISNPVVKAYPFKWSELSTGKIDFLFQKSIYLREPIQGGRTIAGEDLIVQIPLIPITTLDLVQRIRFDIGMALAALLSYRSGDLQTSLEEFSKSCLFGLRCLEILELKTFPIGYNQIYEQSQELITDTECRAVIDAAYAACKESKQPNIDIIYSNISLLDTTIEPKLLTAFNQCGNKELI